MNRLNLLCAGAVLSAAIVTSAIAFRREHRDHARLSAELSQIRAQMPAAERIRAENLRTAELIDLSRRDQRQAAVRLREELERSRQEIAELEAKAKAEHDHLAKESGRRIAALQNNRDLAEGPMLIENCMNVGRATPEATLQTLVWAAAHGHDDVVRSTLVFDPAARALAEAAIGALPESARAEYPTPESLGALFTAQVVNDLSGLRVVDRSVSGTGATLKIAGLQKPLGDVPMIESTDGWQVVIDTHGFERIRRLLLTPRH